MDRSNHYEAAFEAYLQWHKLCYVGVDESRRAFLAGRPVKNLDFIVLGETARLLVDVKGRRFPAGPQERPRKIWHNWSTRDDVDGLESWVELFGHGYQGLLVFLYHLQAQVEIPSDTADLWTWRGKRYLLRAITVEDYRRHMRVRSPKWGTVSLPAANFRNLVRPFHFFYQEPATPVEDW